MEGNKMKMREALLEIAKVADDWERHSPTKAGALDRIYELANAALSEPPRNCDVGTPEEQRERFKAFCRDRQHGSCDGCPIPKKGFCTLQWAQAPDEAEEGGDHVAD